MMKTIFVVQHVRERDDGAESVKLIGTFGSKAAADAAVDRLKSAPGFCTSPNGFSVDAYEIDKIHWTEGFG